MAVPPQPVPASSWSADAAAIMPGICRSASINSSCSARRASALRASDAMARRGRVSSNATRPPGSKPNDTRPRLRRWTTRMADVVRSVKARAISATTNAFDRRRAGAAADARTPSVSTAFGAVRIACQSGARPARTPVATATATLKPSTFQSIVIKSVRGRKPDAAARICPTKITLRPTPATAPATETSAPSAK